MTDLALFWNRELFAADLALDAGALRADGGLESAVIVSLFSDARARADDPLDDPKADRRGWWGDALALVQDDRTGSRLWLLIREKQTPQVLARARTYAAEALAWMIEDGVARSISIDAEYPRAGMLAIGVEITRPDGSVRRFDFAWEDLGKSQS